MRPSASAFNESGQGKQNLALACDLVIALLRIFLRVDSIITNSRCDVLAVKLTIRPHAIILPSEIKGYKHLISWTASYERTRLNDVNVPPISRRSESEVQFCSLSLKKYSSIICTTRT